MADYEYLTDSGVVVADTADLLATVQNEYKLALGAALNTDASTPQGLLITAEVEARAAVVANNAALANQINPAIAGGIFLKALCRLTGFDPPAATYTVVPGVTLTGSPGYTISAGALAKTTAGDLFQLTAPVTLSGAGTATGTFQAVVAGAIPCAAHSLSVAAAVLGWDTVDNATAGVIGQAELSDAELRALRNSTLASQGVSLPEAITSALYDTPGVKSLQFRENIANTTQTIDSVVMAAHSIWACVDGGTDADVAAAILNTKSLGGNYNGAVTVAVVEPASGQTYSVKFDRPTPTRVYARATLRNGSITGDAITIVKNDLVAYALGQVTGLDGFLVGAIVSPFEMAGAIVIQTPGAFVNKIEVSLDGSTWQTTEIDLAIYQQGTLAAGDITVLFV